MVLRVPAADALGEECVYGGDPKAKTLGGNLFI